MSQSPAVAAKPSALSTLLGLTQKKPAVAGAPPQVNPISDPAIAGAKKDRNTVKLGYDPDFAKKARYCAALKQAVDRATEEFEVFQAETRDYGLSKRGLYNSAFHANVTTVCVPYPSSVIEDEGVFRPAPESETKWIQVICTHRFSVAKDMVLANRDAIGADNFDRLFKVETTKKLKPNAEVLFRNLLVEVGVAEDAVDETMAQLFDTDQKVSATEGYEQELPRLPEAVRDLLKQMVTRAAPGLKFPD